MVIDAYYRYSDTLQGSVLYLTLNMSISVVRYCDDGSATKDATGPERSFELPMCRSAIAFLSSGLATRMLKLLDGKVSSGDECN